MLKNNYKDDVLDVTQNTSRKYNLINHEDGTVSLEDKTVYLQNGDTFGASDLNAIVNAIQGEAEVTVPVSGWAANADGYYEVSVPLEGITEDDAPNIWLHRPQNSTKAEWEAQKDAYGLVDRILSGDGSLTVICTEQPKVAFYLNVKGI